MTDSAWDEDVSMVPALDHLLGHSQVSEEENGPASYTCTKSGSLPENSETFPKKLDTFHQSEEKTSPPESDPTESSQNRNETTTGPQQQPTNPDEQVAQASYF